MLLKRGNGQKSTSVTIMWLSWIISIILIVLSMIDVDKTNYGWAIRPVDPSVILFLLGIPSGLYGIRRRQDGQELHDTMENLKK